MNLGRHFPIVYGGKEAVAEIISTFVYEENIYMALDIQGEIELYRILPHGLQVGSRKIRKDFIEHMKEKAEEKRAKEPEAVEKKKRRKKR